MDHENKETFTFGCWNTNRLLVVMMRMAGWLGLITFYHDEHT